MNNPIYTGKINEIPEEEPIFILRSSEKHSIAMLVAFRAMFMVYDDMQIRKELSKIIKDFKEYVDSHRGL